MRAEMVEELYRIQRERGEFPPSKSTDVASEFGVRRVRLRFEYIPGYANCCLLCPIRSRAEVCTGYLQYLADIEAQREREALGPQLPPPPPPRIPAVPFEESDMAPRRRRRLGQPPEREPFPTREPAAPREQQREVADTTPRWESHVRTPPSSPASTGDLRLKYTTMALVAAARPRRASEPDYREEYPTAFLERALQKAKDSLNSCVCFFFHA
jgi:hypothetical protein